MFTQTHTCTHMNTFDYVRISIDLRIELAFAVFAEHINESYL